LNVAKVPKFQLSSNRCRK